MGTQFDQGGGASASQMLPWVIIATVAIALTFDAQRARRARR